MFNNREPATSSQINVHSMSGELVWIGWMWMLESEVEPLRWDLTAFLQTGLSQSNHTPELTSRHIGSSD